MGFQRVGAPDPLSLPVEGDRHAVGVTLDPYSFPCDGALLGIPHFWNVVTNLPFLVVGAAGLRAWRRRPTSSAARRAGWLGVWISAVALSLGSGAYHLWLTPATLALDRACVIAITGFLAYQAMATDGWVRPGTLAACVIVGLFEASVVAWWFGVSSLLYGGLQALAAVAVLWLYARAARREPGTLELRWLVGMVVCYALAKVFELLDEEVCAATGFIGGHPLKHLLSAAGLAALLRFMLGGLEIRRPRPLA
jgi:hypothetical protein